MKTQNFMVDFLKLSAGNMAESTKNKSMQGGFFPEFKTILDKSTVSNQQTQVKDKTENKTAFQFNRNNNNQVSKPEEKTEKPVDNSTETKEGAQKSKSISTEEKTNKVSETKGEKNEKNNMEKALEKEKKDIENDEMSDAIANAMGIKKEDFSAILNLLNIDPAKLNNDNDLEDLTNKLTELMDLNSDQKNTLSQLINVVKNTLQETKGESNETGWVKLEGVNVEVIKVKNPDEKFKSLIEDFKQKIQQMSDQLKSNPEKFVHELSQKITEKLVVNPEAVQKEEIIKEDNAKEVGTKEIGVKGTSIKLESDSSQEKVQATNQPKKDESTQNNLGQQQGMQLGRFTQENAAKVETQSKGDFTNVINTIETNQNDKSNLVSAVQKAPKEIPITKNEIINQVVEKAKVIINGDKSEMTMDLKPEHLGKLSLKVVTEHGIVMAKIVAENEQVKSILESNMQLLKDSLQKQGLAVQDFSVSVGQDSRQNFAGGNPNQSSGFKGSAKLNSVNARGINISNLVQSNQSLNPYTRSEGSINLTA